MVQPLWKTGSSLKYNITKIELPYDPAIPLLDIYPREMKTYVHKNFYLKFMVAPFRESRGKNNPNVHQLMDG